MTTRDRHYREERPQRRKTPSFSSSLLDAIYHSVDQTKGVVVERPKGGFTRRDNALVVEHDVTSLRRAIMIEKWMESCSKSARGSSRQFNSDSSSSTESSMFSSETESASRCTPKSSASHAQALHSERSHKSVRYEATSKHESKFTRTKSRALKIYGDLKKVKQPMSPGSKIANFLNSIFHSRNVKKHQTTEEWSSSLRKSRSVKEPTTCSFSSRSCLSKAPSPISKSKRSVRFGPVSVIVGAQDNQPWIHHKGMADDGDSGGDPSLMPMPKISSHFIKENICNLRSYEEMKESTYESRDLFNQEVESESEEDDIRSCTSSDLFELENISVAAYREELPVYGTTNLKINQAIANGCLCT